MKLRVFFFLCALTAYTGAQTSINGTNLAVSSLAVSPANPSIVVGGTIAFSCVATLGAGAAGGNGGITQSVTNQVNWQSSAPAVATMGSTNVAGFNVATGVTAGTSTVSCTDGAGDVGSTTLTIVAIPEITNPAAATCATPCPLPGATQSITYTSFFVFAASGGVAPYTWTNSVGAPPAGMSLSSGGVLSGTPSGTGTTTWTVQVCDSGSHCVTLQVSLLVSAAAGCGTPGSWCAYTGVDTRAWPGSVPNVGQLTKNGSTVTDTSLPASTQSPIVRCTDFAIGTGATTTTYNEQSKSAGLGGSGAKEQLFNLDSTMLHFNASGGQGYITLFNPSTVACGDPITGFAITGDKKTPAGTTGVPYNFGNGSFSWTDSEVTSGYSAYYAVGSGLDTTVSTQAAQYTIKKADGTFTVVTPYFDFANGLPWTTTQAPAWQANHSYAYGDYISYQLTGLGDWNGAIAWALGDLIQPLTNNPLNCVFKLAVLGTRGTQPNPWSSLADGSCSAEVALTQLKTEGGGVEAWRNVGTGQFVFQNTSGNGTSGSSTPTFATVPTGAQTVHPDLMTTATDNGITWMNSGPLVHPVWHSFAGISKNGDRWCSAFSSNAYGHGAGSYNGDTGSQGTGIWAECYSFSANTYYLLNTATGIQSVVTCSGGTGYTCSGGTQSKLTASGTAAAAISTGCNFPIHNLEQGSTADYVVIADQGKYNGNCPISADGKNVLFDWQPFAAYSSSTTLQAYNTLSGHWAIGKSKLVNNNATNINFGFSSGAYTAVLDSANPGAAATTSWQVGAPYTTACDVNWVANDLNPACNWTTPYDSHLAFWHDASDDDLGPVCGTIYNNVSNAPPPIAPWQQEEICESSSPTWNPSVGPIGAWKVWRFTHTFNSGGSSFFDTQFAISQLSQDGKFLAFSSDWNCSMGNINGSTTNTFCGAPWVAGATYTLNQLVNPFQNTGGSGTNYGVYKITNIGTQGGVASLTKPSWFVCNSSSAGSTVTDLNGVVYTCQGSGNGKGEVFVVGLK